MSWRSILPGRSVLARYERSWLRADLLAGLTVGAMLVPQSMAYAELAGLPPSAGFFAALGATGRGAGPGCHGEEIAVSRSATASG